MTIIIFYDHQLRDVVAPSRSLRLQAGRGGSPERFWLSNGSAAVFLDAGQASVFLNGLGKLHRCVQRGRLADRSFYSHDIYGVTGGVLGVDLGILAGRPYIGVDSLRVDVSVDDLDYLAHACSQAHYLAGGIGIASQIARTPPGPRPWWEGYGRSLDPTPLGSAWYDD